MRSEKFKEAYLHSLAHNVSSFYDNVSEYGNPNSKNCIYYIYGLDGAPGQVRFVLPAISRYFDDDFYIKGLSLPEFSTRKPSWEKYTIENIEKKIVKIVDDLTLLTERYGNVIVCCCSSGFYDFYAATGRLSARAQSLLTLLWVACAPDHVESSLFSYAEKTMFKLNGFIHEGHRWAAYPYIHFLSWYNSAYSYRHLSRVKKPYRYSYQHDVQSRFYIYGTLWSYFSLNIYNEHMSDLVKQSSKKLSMPTYILAAQYDGLWQGTSRMRMGVERYIESPVFVVRPASHMWVAAPEYLYSFLQTVFSSQIT